MARETSFGNQKMSDVSVVPLTIWAEGKSDNEISDFLCSFSCEDINKDVHRFFRKKSLAFARSNISATHLVLSSDFNNILAFYTLVCKPLSVNADGLTEENQNSLELFCRLNKSTNCYAFSAYLIAQLGLNYAPGLNGSLNGDELMALILDHLRRIRINLGGNLTFVEYETGNKKLFDYYTRNGFVSLQSTSDSDDKLDQLFCFID